MRFRILAACGLACLVACIVGRARPGSADETRTVMVNGMPFQETYRVVRQPVTGIDWQQQEVTRFVERHTTEMREQQRPVHVPHVRYEWRARVRNRWNPFVRPSVVYEPVARTQWETRLESVRVPLVRREVVPEKRLVDVPRRTLGFEDRRELVSRVPLPASQGTVVASQPRMLAPPPPANLPSVVGPPALGGVERYDGSYPARRPAAATLTR